MASRRTKQSRQAVARDSKKPLNTDTGQSFGILNIILTLVIVAGCGFVVWSFLRPNASDTRLPTVVHGNPLPRLEKSISADGKEVVRTDLEALGNWCRVQSLPEPPLFAMSDPFVLSSFHSALADWQKSPSAESLGRLGKICISLQGTQSAEKYFELAAKADPHNYRWPYFLGCIYQDTGRQDEAIRALQSSLKLDSSYPVTHARLGQLLLEKGKLGEAEVHFQQYINLRPKDWLGYTGLGRVALSKNQALEALAHLQKAQTLGPRDFQTCYHLGETYKQLGKTERAEEQFALCRNLSRGDWHRPRDPLLLEADAITNSTQSLLREFTRLKDSQDWDRLLELGEEILRRQPGHIGMTQNVASIYRKLGRAGDGHRVLDAAELLSGDEPPLKVTRAELFLFEKRLDEAVAAADAALTQLPNDVAALAAKGRALLLLGWATEAEAAMRRAIELSPEKSANYFVLAEALRLGQKIAEACEWYKKTRAALPDHAEAANRMVELGCLP